MEDILFEQIADAAEDLKRIQGGDTPFPEVREQRVAEAEAHLADLLEKAKLGSGGRFKALEKELTGKKGVYDPKGLAAYIGRKKYGAKKMAAMAAKGK